MRSTLSHDKVFKWAKAKVHVCSDSVLCLGKMQEHSEANKQLKDQLQYLQRSNGYQELNGIDGKPKGFEWYIFPGHTTLQILQEIQHRMEVCQTSPKEFEDRLIFRSMFNNIDWTEKGSTKNVLRILQQSTITQKKLQLGHWSSHCMDRCTHQDRSNSSNQNQMLS